MPTRSFLLTLLALLGCGSFAFAAEADSAASDKPARLLATADSGGAKPMLIAARATPVPVATPIPDKRNLFNKIFGGGGSKKTNATPAPATPVKVTRKPTARPKKPADDGNSDPTESKPNATPEKVDKTDKTEKPDKPDDQSKPPTTPKPRNGGKAAKGGSDANAGKVGGGDPEENEKARYEEVKTKAIGDKSVQELREKADNALTEEDGRKALRAYNKALFQKMRALDSSLDPRIDKMEAAILKQLDDKQ